MGIASASNGKYKTIMHCQPLLSHVENLGNNMRTSGPERIFLSTINTAVKRCDIVFPEDIMHEIYQCENTDALS